MELKGKTAIITGASSGIGKSCALLFAEEGVRAVIVGRNVENLRSVSDDMQLKGTDVLLIKCDITQEPEVIKMVEKAVGFLKEIDILVNSAGISSVGNPKPIHETSYEIWRKIIDTNLTGTFLCCKHTLPYMMKNDGGNIINFGSTYSFLAAPKLGPYATTKGGLVQLTRNIAIDYAPYNIRANILIPGFIDTPMLNVDIKKEPDPDAVYNKVINRILLKRLGTPDEMAKAVLFLVSDKATYFTGSMIISDGGYSIF